MPLWYQIAPAQLSTTPVTSVLPGHSVHLDLLLQRIVLQDGIVMIMNWTHQQVSESTPSHSSHIEGGVTCPGENHMGNRCQPRSLLIVLLPSRFMMTYVMWSSKMSRELANIDFRIEPIIVLNFLVIWLFWLSLMTKSLELNVQYWYGFPQNIARSWTWCIHCNVKLFFWVLLILLDRIKYYALRGLISSRWKRISTSFIVIIEHLSQINSWMYEDY